jgi:hypothetical protein
MSVSTGRMSRADASHLLLQIRSAAQEFVAKTPSEPANPEAFGILSLAALEENHLDASRDNLPRANVIRDLRTRVAALQFERYQTSSATPPRVSRAVCVTLYGEDDRILSVNGAADIAAQHLGTVDDVRLQDSSHVRTATLTGTRYIFTSRTP